MSRSAEARARPLTPESFEIEADVLRALAHPKRLMILARIGDGHCSVTELASDLGLSLPNVSQHLRVLRDRRVVRPVRSGQIVRYRLTHPVFARCCAMVRRVIVEGTAPLAALEPESAEPVPRALPA